MNNYLIGRKLPITTPRRCDFDNGVIDVNKQTGKGFAFQITGDETVRAQGIYHGNRCYEEALRHMQELEKENG